MAVYFNYKNLWLVSLRVWLSLKIHSYISGFYYGLYDQATENWWPWESHHLTAHSTLLFLQEISAIDVW